MAKKKDEKKKKDKKKLRKRKKGKKAEKRNRDFFRVNKLQGQSGQFRLDCLFFAGQLTDN